MSNNNNTPCGCRSNSANDTRGQTSAAVDGVDSLDSGDDRFEGGLIETITRVVRDLNRRIRLLEGAPVPPKTYSEGGFVNGDTFAEDDTREQRLLLELEDGVLLPAQIRSACGAPALNVGSHDNAGGWSDSDLCCAKRDPSASLDGVNDCFEARQPFDRQDESLTGNLHISIYVADIDPNVFHVSSPVRSGFDAGTSDALAKTVADGLSARSLASAIGIDLGVKCSDGVHDRRENSRKVVEGAFVPGFECGLQISVELVSDCAHVSSPVVAESGAGTPDAPAMTVQEGGDSEPVAPGVGDAPSPASSTPRFVVVGSRVYDRDANKVAACVSPSAARSVADELNTGNGHIINFYWEDAK